MKKICYVVTVSSTIWAFFLPQLSELVRKGYDVTVICNDTINIKDYLEEKIHVINLDIPRGMSPVKMLTSLVKMTRIFISNRYNYIQYSTPNAALCASIASWISRCPIRNYHLMGYRYLGEKGLMRFLLKKLEKIACCLSTDIECVSKTNIEIGLKDGIFAGSKVSVVWNGSTGGVDLKRYDIKKRSLYRKEIRDKYGLNEDDFIFGFVGRITRDKGINEILGAFKNIKNAKLMLIGAEEGVQTLDQSLYKASKISANIFYTDTVADVEKYYAAIDVLLLPSYREGFGNVVIEAAAMGTPAIISNIPGPIDAVEVGTTAVTVEPKNMISLRDEMNNFLKGKYCFIPESCNEYVKLHFDSEELCTRVVAKRISMMGE